MGSLSCGTITRAAQDERQLRVSREISEGPSRPGIRDSPPDHLHEGCLIGRVELLDPACRCQIGEHLKHRRARNGTAAQVLGQAVSERLSPRPCGLLVPEQRLGDHR
jgi:hypothetical protein